jgi:PAS domain S-box-containing protein
MALIESEERFRHLVENAADALILHDGQGNIVSVNQRCCDRLGYRREELQKMTVFQIVRGADPGELLTTWENYIPGQSVSFEREHIRKDGTLYPVEVNVVSYDSHGRRLYIAVARDVSQRKRQEAELAKYRNQLEGLVRERTRQLEDAQHELVASERLAVLGQLTATVSHELRNPLGTVKNAIYLVGRIKNSGDAEKMDKALDLADRNIRRCDNIINELLDFTRQQEGTAEKIDLGPWVQSVLDEQTLPDEIDLQSDLPTGVVVSVNPERLRRAVINVFSNAVQSFETQDNDCKKLSIVLSTVDQRVQIVVTDNGSGISDEVMARIFEPMFSTRNFGVGLGMAIVKNIMEEQGGGVELESRPGIGTSVFLWLPQSQEILDEQPDSPLEQNFEI